ncbi:MAG TPA: hypothetical protein LFW21_00530 [Rickettsia endosymbiont of Pyrocoelia pectoralis]|nr:hypothetical protein [Rickettsia endosymbiont of Pyrocoelia pectoralis]
MNKNNKVISIEEVIDKAFKNERINALIASGELTLLAFDSFYNSIIPLESLNKVILSPSEAINILKYLKLRKDKPCYLVYKFKLNSSKEESFGILLKIYNIELDKQNFAWMDLSYEKTIRIIDTKIFESQEYVKIKEVQCFTKLNNEKLKKIVEDTLDIVKNFYFKRRENLNRYRHLM